MIGCEALLVFRSVVAILGQVSLVVTHVPFVAGQFVTVLCNVPVISGQIGVIGSEVVPILYEISPVLGHIAPISAHVSLVLSDVMVVLNNVSPLGSGPNCRRWLGSTRRRSRAWRGDASARHPNRQQPQQGWVQQTFHHDRFQVHRHTPPSDSYSHARERLYCNRIFYWPVDTARR